MDVSGAVRVTTHDAQQLGRRTRRVNGVLGGLEAVKGETAFGVGLELAAQVVAGLVLGVKDVVLAVCAGLPHVKDSVGNALAGLDVAHHTVEPGDLAVGGQIQNDRVAHFTEGGLGGPEGAEDGRRGGLKTLCGGNLVVDFVDEAV